jgi:hypothetical protein
MESIVTFENIPMFEFLSDSRTPVVERNFYMFLSMLETKEEQKKFVDYIQGKGVSLFKFPTWKDIYKDTGSNLKALDKKEKVCQICGKEFIGSGKAKFCSNACRQKNKYLKSKEGI